MVSRGCRHKARSELDAWRSQRANGTHVLLDLAGRFGNLIQLTSDSHGAYLKAVEGAFGHEVDYAQLQKIYGETSESEKRYSPAQCIGCKRQELVGDPDPKHISTSFVEGIISRFA
jgi:hypothetical protein